MDDLGLNEYLKNHYGATVDGKPLFRLTWSTGVKEKRHSTFIDFYGEVFLREVTETREVLKYPYAQDRWILEKIKLVSERARNEFGLITDEPFSYEPIYTFQDKEGKYLPLNLDMLDSAMYLYFKFYLQMTDIERRDVKISLLAQKDQEKRDAVRAALANKQVQAASSFVLERAAGIERKEKRNDQ